MKSACSIRARCGLLLVALAMGLGAMPGVFAQDVVWRCGPEGRSYSAQPCADGRPIAVADPRDDAQRAQAQDAAERESRLAQQLGQERRQREHVARQAGQGAAGIKPLASAPPGAERAAASAPPHARGTHGARATKPTRKRRAHGRPAH
ncbi:MAG: hypothetical protein AMXMBFR78_15710 [Rubrivivax sp.]|jgi:hypothetical protein|nr:hypothetical protein [Rubrivivax sp.]